MNCEHHVHKLHKIGEMDTKLIQKRQQSTKVPSICPSVCLGLRICLCKKLKLLSTFQTERLRPRGP